jgi:stress-induced morphogen
VSIVKSKICPLYVCDLVRRRYDQLSWLASSSNGEISRLSIIVKDLKERLESIEKDQHDLLDKVNSIEAELHPHKRGRRKSSKYACDMCSARFKDSKHLQSHRKGVHGAPYNI